MKKIILPLSWLVTLIVPVAVVLTVVFLIMNPWYLDFEYRTPGFPADKYGFTLQDRIKYANIALDFLLNNAGIEYVAELRFPEGQQAPEPSCSFMDDCTFLYNTRELKHFIDAKNVAKTAQVVWWTSLLVQGVMSLWAWRGRWWNSFRRGIWRGGWLTLILIGGLVLFVLMAFSVIFVLFHEIFFAPGTWTFFFSDTFIRLFPERFWRDTFLIVGVLSALFSFTLIFLSKSRKPTSY